MAVLHIESLRKTYTGSAGHVQALDDVSLQVQQGEFVAVEGPSGSGKSTLLLTAGGLLAPDAGRVSISGQELYALSPDGRARFRAQHLGYVFQQYHLVPYLTILENVLAACLAVERNGAAQRAKEIIEHFGLGHRVAHRPGQLSVGEKQRVALARAMLNRPALLLADEPTGNLDTANASAVLEYMREYVREGGAVLLVTHDDRAARVATRNIRLANGRIETR